MSISGVGGAGSFFQSSAARAAAQQTQAAAADDSGLTSDTPNATNSAVQGFLNYAKESPAQRMVDDWLKAHGLTEQELDKMPPDKQAAIRKEMEADIKKEIQEQVQKKTGADPKSPVPTGSLANILA